MSEAGHVAWRQGNAFVDAWGDGPFLIVDQRGRVHRFEDSRLIGPTPVDSNGDISGRGYFGARHPFWKAWSAWVAEGRRVAEDGVTCIVGAEPMTRPAPIDPPQPGKGSRWADREGEVRVLGVVEGYVVARRKGCAPFLSSVREFLAAFERVAP